MAPFPEVPRAYIAPESVTIPVGAVRLPGDLTLPPHATGLVIFAHGSGSSRLSRRNQQVAEALVEAGLGTLLFDLLTIPESRDRANVFDIGLLAERLSGVAAWAARQPATADLPIGLFGASTGAAAALAAAAAAPHTIGAVVSRGGRPDLAGAALDRVLAPTLLIVGGRDEAVLPLNRAALARLQCVRELHIVPGAGHLFEEPGALAAVADLAARWFTCYLGRLWD
jgi:putative phosphoribosyl transferase